MTLPHFQNPQAFLLLALIPLLALDYLRRHQQRRASIRFPSLAVVKRMPPSTAYRLRHILIANSICYRGTLTHLGRCKDTPLLQAERQPRTIAVTPIQGHHASRGSDFREG